MGLNQAIYIALCINQGIRSDFWLSIQSVTLVHIYCHVYHEMKIAIECLAMPVLI